MKRFFIALAVASLAIGFQAPAFADENSGDSTDAETYLAPDSDREFIRPHFRWIYSYRDRNGCRSCRYTCYSAPRCSWRIVGEKMACKIRGTHNDYNVYECARW